MSQISSASESGKIRDVIQAFLKERLQAKLDKLKEGKTAERQQILEDFQLENWIADAANKADKVQLASHAIKFSHSDAGGSSLNSVGNPHADEHLVGTHTLGSQQSSDVVVSTAAYLPVYEFLSLSVDDESIFRRCLAQDPSLSAAFSDNAETARSWIAAFANLAQPKGKPASHTLAKQIYWPLEDCQYHLLSPLFPTSLAHSLWSRIRDSRFSEEINAARKAFRENKIHHSGYLEYPNLVLQKFGGTKPQNISQLNNDRHGENYLLDARPPVFRSQECRPLLGVASLFDGPFEQYGSVRSKVYSLKKHLKKVQWREHGNLEIRTEREKLLAEICDSLLNYAAELQLKLPSGWTQNPDCRLKQAEQYWLDPARAATDAEFAAQRSQGDWRQEIANSFGVWLNRCLDTKKMHFDQYAADHWKKAIEKELNLLRLEVDDD